MVDPKVVHIALVKRILRYLKRTTNYGIFFPKESKSNLIGFSDNDWCGDKEDRKSVIGYFFKFQGAPISWCSKKQQIVALSSCETGYIAAVYCVCQGVWLKSFIEELHLSNEENV